MGVALSNLSILNLLIQLGRNSHLRCSIQLMSKVSSNKCLANLPRCPSKPLSVLKSHSMMSLPRANALPIIEIICSLQYFTELSKLSKFQSPQPLFPPRQQSPCNSCVKVSLWSLRQWGNLTGQSSFLSRIGDVTRSYEEGQDSLDELSSATKGRSQECPSRSIQIVIVLLQHLRSMKRTRIMHSER